MEPSTGLECAAKAASLAKDLVQALPNLVSRVRQEWSFRASNAFTTYIRTAFSKYDKVKTLLNPETPRPLLDFYVPLDLTSDSCRYEAASVTSLDKIGSHFIISGTAGSGKSTLLRYFFYQTLLNGVNIPVLIELRRLNIGSKSVFDAIYETLDLGGFKLPPEFLKRALQSGKVTLLLDAYDEVNEDRRSVIGRQIDNLSVSYPNCKIFMTSRPDSEFLSWSRFIEVEVCPLTKQQALQLAKNLDYVEDVKQRFLRDLDERLFESHSDFLSNPLLLIMMLLNYHENADVPNSKHVFYSQVFATLYNKHDATKDGYKRRIKSALAVDQFEAVLQAFSIQTYFDSLPSIPQNKLSDYLAHSRDLSGIEFSTDDFLEDCKKAVCLLVEDGFYCTYAHRTFQEYFAARFVSKQDDVTKGELLNKLLQGFITNEFLEILFGLDKEYIEAHVIGHRIDQLLEESGDKGVPTQEGFFTLFVKQFHDFDLHPEGGGVTIGQFGTGFSRFIKFLRDSYGSVISNPLRRDLNGWDIIVARLRSFLHVEDYEASVRDYLSDDIIQEGMMKFSLFCYQDYTNLYLIKEDIEKRSARVESGLLALMKKRKDFGWER